jgi:lysozyme family protein
MKITLFFVLFFIGFAACNKTIYVPVESVRTEYRDNYLRDSVYVRDSIFIKVKGDTVWIEIYKYIYKDKFVRDSVYLNDTIRVPYPVDVPGERVNYLTGWQNFQIWLGRALILIILGYFLKKRFS